MYLYKKIHKYLCFKNRSLHYNTKAKSPKHICEMVCICVIIILILKKMTWLLKNVT